MAIPKPIRWCHLVNRDTACFPGQESVDWSVAIGSVAPPNITSGSDLMKEPFTTQVTFTRFEIFFQKSAILRCDPCPHGRYVYVYANSPSPSTIQLCSVEVRGDGKSLMVQSHAVWQANMLSHLRFLPIISLSPWESLGVLFTISLIKLHFMIIFIMIVVTYYILTTCLSFL